MSQIIKFDHMKEEDLENGRALEDDLEDGRAREDDLEDGRAREDDLEDGRAREDDLEDGRAREDDLEDGRAREDDLEDGRAREDRKARMRPKTKWEQSETADLIDGCSQHGVGAWKRIYNDPKYFFPERTPVDLKDRFRTLYPREWNRLYPDAQRVRISKEAPSPPPFNRIRRRRRRPFTQEEDERLRRGVKKHGVAWSNISRDPRLGLLHRRGTDLRDRFRHAFPDEYEALGYSMRRKKSHE